MYLAPQNIPRAISVLALGNKVILCIVFLKLFDAQVQPVTEYGSEIWGLDKAAIHTEQVRLFVLKRLLGVGMKTLNDLVHGETDRFPITLNSAVRCIRYWLKITWMVKTIGAWGNRNWFSNAGMQLLESGFVSVMMNQGVARLNEFIRCFHERWTDCRWQNWEVHVKLGSVYITFKCISHCTKMYTWTDNRNVS